MTEHEPRQPRFGENKPATPAEMVGIPELPKAPEYAAAASLTDVLKLNLEKPDLDLGHPSGDNVSIPEVKRLPEDQDKVRIVAPYCEEDTKTGYPSHFDHSPIHDDGDSHDTPTPISLYLEPAGKL